MDISKVEEWNVDADIVILGYGVAGGTAALEAQRLDPDAKVIIFEKMPEDEAGGNSRVSGQSLTFPNDLEDYLKYQRVLNEGNPIPEPLLRAWGEARNAQYDWVDALAREVGFELIKYKDCPAEFPEMPGAECIDGIYTLRPADGTPSPIAWNISTGAYPSGVWLCVKANVDRRPEIDVHYETRAVDLVQDRDTREVFGVVAHRNGEELVVKARRGVVMCVGGYEASQEMVRNYAGYEEVIPYGTPGNTGDGIRMLQAAGADLWHLQNRVQTTGIYPGFPIPGYRAPVMRNATMSAWSWIDIGRDNSRFYAEAQEYYYSDTHFKHNVHGRWEDVPTARRGPVHMLFDEGTRAAGCLAWDSLGWTSIVDGHEWSADNSKEVDAGLIVLADSVRELATKIGRDPDAVETAVHRYNGFARAGVDEDFKRNSSRMVPIELPPFYAVEIVGGLISTTGGAKRDNCGRVLDQRGEAIPRLFEAGELGSFHSDLYQNGSMLTEAMLSGRWAASSAVLERSWV